MRATPITPNSIQLTKYGLVNCYLVRETDSFTLVDAAVASARQLLAYPIERFACGHGAIRTGGLAEFQQAVTEASSKS